MSPRNRILKVTIIVIVLSFGVPYSLQGCSQGSDYRSTEDGISTIPYPGLILEYSILVTLREENSPIAIPIPANLTVNYNDYLNETVINSTLNLSSEWLTLVLNSTENGEFWENVTTREVQEVNLNQTTLLAIFYEVYENETAENYTPFWIFQRNWAIGDRFGAYNYILEIKDITNVKLRNYGERTGIIATVNRTVAIDNIPYVRDNATMIYDLETGLLIKGEILNWNALYYDPPRIYTLRIELDSTNYPQLIPATSSQGNVTQPSLPPLFSVSRTSAAYVLLSIFIPAGIAVVNFSRIRRIQGGG